MNRAARTAREASRTPPCPRSVHPDRVGITPVPRRPAAAGMSNESGDPTWSLSDAAVHSHPRDETARPPVSSSSATRLPGRPTSHYALAEACATALVPQSRRRRSRLESDAVVLLGSPSRSATALVRPACRRRCRQNALAHRGASGKPQPAPETLCVRHRTGFCSR